MKNNPWWEGNWDWDEGREEGRLQDGIPSPLWDGVQQHSVRWCSWDLMACPCLPLPCRWLPWWWMSSRTSTSSETCSRYVGSGEWPCTSFWTRLCSPTFWTCAWTWKFILNRKRFVWYTICIFPSSTDMTELLGYTSWLVVVSPGLRQWAKSFAQSLTANKHLLTFWLYS